LRKIFLLVLVFGLLLSSMPVMGASVPSTIITKEEAVNTVRQQLDVSDDYKLENVSFEERQEMEEQVWYLYFRKDDAENFGSVSVRIDAVSEEILSFDRYERQEGEGPAIITRDEAQQLAETVIKNYQPDKFKSLKLMENERDNSNTGSTRISFQFNRMIDGYLFPANGFSVTVDTSQKEVTAYRYQWSKDLVYADESSIITKEEAVNKFKDVDKTRLIYIMTRDKDNKEQGLKLVYTSELPNSGLIDAITGELVPREKIYQPYIYQQKVDGAGMKELANDESGRAAPQTIPDEGVISKEKAAAIAAKTLAPIADFKEMELSSASYYQYTNTDKKEWQLNWRTPFVEEEKPGRTQNVRAVLNAEDGSITRISYYKSPALQSSDEKAKGFSFKELKGLAGAVVNKVFPEKITQIQFVEQEDGYGLPRPVLQAEKLTTAINAERLINDIPFPENNISFRFDPETSELLSFNYQWQGIEVPAGAETISLEGAEDIYYQQAGLKIQYVRLQEDAKPLKDVLLTYGVKQHDFSYLDAVSGELLDYRGSKMPEEKNAAPLTDISGHWAERELNIMFDQGIIESSDGHFYPERQIKRQEAVKMLVLARGRTGEYDTVTFKDVPKDHPYHKYVEAAVRMGIIEKGDGYFHPENNISRQDFAVALVRFAGFDKVAELEGIFKVPFKDAGQIAPEKVGYVALTNGFKIMNGAGGYFRPQKLITRAETAISLYRAIGIGK